VLSAFFGLMGLFGMMVGVIILIIFAVMKKPLKPVLIVYSGASGQRSSHIRPSNPMGFGHLVK